MRELLLGGDGLIGTELARLLSARGHSVVSLDLRSGIDLRRAEPAPFEEADRVWFLAWDAGGARFMSNHATQHEQFIHNIALCSRVFELLRETGVPFLFTTSVLAGAPTAYGACKQMAEQWTRHLGGRLARLWNVYGWEDAAERSHVIPDLVAGGLQGLVACRTDGAERRRFIHVSDGARALVRLFDSDAPRGDIAGSEWVSVRDVAERIGAQLGVPCVFGEALGEETLIEPREPVAGWEAQISLDEGLAQVIAAAQADGLDAAGA